MPKVLAVAEQRDGALRGVSAEVVTAARVVVDGVGGEVDVVVAGPPGVAGEAGGLGRYGAERVWVVESDALRLYSPEGMTEIVAELIRGQDYYAVLFPGSALGKDLAPRVAARLELPLAGDAVGLAVEDGELVVTRPVYGGRAMAEVVLEAEPRLVTVRPNMFRPEERPAAGSVERLDVGIRPESWRVRVREVVTEHTHVDVAEAPIVVSGGRGMKGPENWHLLEELCMALGPQCALGASRAVVDAGWRPHSEQVGQTGKTVSPQLYIAAGISGAMQHLAGIRGARTIVAINKDPDAPIFKVATYGIVGDVLEVLPRLTEEIRKLRAAG